MTTLRRTEVISLVNLMVKLSESIQFYKSFLKQETEESRRFYGGRWVIMVVIMRFVGQVMQKMQEKKEEEKLGEEREGPGGKEEREQIKKKKE